MRQWQEGEYWHNGLEDVTESVDVEIMLVENGRGSVAQGIVFYSAAIVLKTGEGNTNSSKKAMIFEMV